MCTPESLARPTGDGFYAGRHLVIVNLDLFSTRALRVWVEDKVRATNGDIWKELANQLARSAHWEFEDYLP